MPTVLFTSALQRFLPVPSAQVTGATIAEVVAAVFASEPRLRGYVLDVRELCDGTSRSMSMVGRISDRARLADAVAPDDEIYVFQELSGG